MDVECVDTEGQLCSVTRFSTQKYKIHNQERKKMDGQESEIRFKILHFIVYLLIYLFNFTPCIDTSRSKMLLVGQRCTSLKES